MRQVTARRASWLIYKRLQRSVFPENNTTKYFYHRNGRLSEKRDAKSQKITYEYDTNQRLKVVRQYGYPTANAGRIDTATNTISGEVVSYIYDEFGRLTNANVQQWTQQYFYDGFGNLFKKTGTGLAQGWGFDYTPLLNSAKNQIGTHDPNGNPTNEIFDIENRLTRVNHPTLGTHYYQFGYDTDNRRVMRVKTAGAQVTTEVHFYWQGKRLGRYTLTTGFQTTQEDLYIGQYRVAPQDRLASAADARLLPYGEELSTTSQDRVKFATYFRDEWGYDYADQRHYAQGRGRFLTPDPYLASGGPANPNSWNRYAYVEGDPVNYSDPRGLERIYESDYLFQVTVTRSILGRSGGGGGGTGPEGPQLMIDTGMQLGDQTGGGFCMTAEGGISCEEAERRRRVEEGLAECKKDIDEQAAEMRQVRADGRNARFLKAVGTAMTLGALQGMAAGAAGGAVAGGLPGGLAGAAAGAFVVAVVEVTATATWTFWAQELAETIAFDVGQVQPMIKSGYEDCEQAYHVP